jgi:hypothetical protein
MLAELTNEQPKPETTQVSHQFALDLILRYACPYEVDTKKGHLYHIEVHCQRFLVRAKPLGEFRYEIVSIERVLA